MPSLRGLHPAFRPFAERFFRMARAAYPGLVVTSGKRSRWEQARLYREYLAGRNGGLPAVPPGTSDHEFGLAWDMARPGIKPFSDGALAVLGEAWRREGGRWSSKDPVHFAAPASLKRRRRRR